MIYSLTSDLPTFKDLQFRPGLNVLLADRTPGSTDRQTRNGAGKSSFVELVHFLLGSNASPDSLLRKAPLAESSFTLELDLGEGRTRASRRGAMPSKIRVAGDWSKDWPIQPTVDRKTRENTVSNANWRLLLGAVFFGLDGDPDEDGSADGEPSFRSLFSYFARRQRSGGLVTHAKHSEMQQLWDQQTALSYLLDLDWTIPYRLQLVRAREKVLGDLRKAAGEGAFGAILGTSAELRTELVVAQDRAHQLRKQLEEFRVVPQYEVLEKEASALTVDINELADRNTADRLLVDQIERALGDERAPAFEDLRRVYDEAGVLLPTTVMKRFEDVQAFHESVIRNRRSYLESELQSARARVAERDLSKVEVDTRRRQIMGILKAGGALEHFAAMQSEVAVLEAASESLRQRYQSAQQLEGQRTELTLERALLLKELQRDYAEREETLREAILAFERVSEFLYEEAGRLQIEPTSNGPEVRVEIQASDSKGINNMQIFCFDMMLMQLSSTRHRGPGFLIHDSHLFDGVDTRQVAKALEIGAKLAEAFGFQYIVTLNSDAIPTEFSDGWSIDKHILATRLTDEGAGGLFGIRFD